VDDDRVQIPNADYASIQAAVNAAQTGDLILVAPGSYQEQVTINKSLSIQGIHSDTWHASGWSDHTSDDNSDQDWDNDSHNNAGSAIILAPANLGSPTSSNPGAIVRVTGSGVDVEIKHLTIEGISGGTANLCYGVRVDGGATAEIEQNTITNIINSGDTRFGVAINVGNSAGGVDGTGDQVGSAEIFHNSIVNYSRAGIVVNHAASWAEVKNNYISALATNVDSQTGVEVSDGAAAIVRNNKILGNNNNSNGTGVLLFSPGAITLPDFSNHWDWEDHCGTHDSHIFYTTVENNTISGNDYGVFGISVGTVLANQNVSALVKNNSIKNNTYVGVELDYSSAVSVNSNSISGNGTGHFEADGGIFLFQSTGNLVDNNSSFSNNGCGVYLDAGSTGNTIQNNSFQSNLDNASLHYADAVDLTTGNGTAGTGNQWVNDKGQTFITTSGQTLFKQRPKGSY
jgi:parallel beta-helix repeat protein